MTSRRHQLSTGAAGKLTRRPRRASPPTARTAVAIIATAGLALLAAGCGGSSSTGSGGSPTAGGPTSSQSTNSQVLAFSHCMRSHGVSSFPDPDSSGKLPKPELVDARRSNSPRFDAANSACQHLLPGGGPSPQAEQQQERRERSAMVRFAQCMRSHGVPNFPDPTNDSRGRPVFTLPRIDEGSPQLIAKAQECQSLLHLAQLPAHQFSHGS